MQAAVARFPLTYDGQWLWVPAFAGTTLANSGRYIPFPPAI
jgi:hypothetical protein